MVTNAPPEKSTIRPAFLNGGSLDCQSMGRGIVMRYMSVTTFRTTVTKMSILEMAGWQKSRGGQHQLKGFWCTAQLTARVGIDLPVLLQRITSKQDGQKHGDPCHYNQNESDVYPHFEVLQAVGKAKIEGAHSSLDDPQEECVC